MIINPISKGGNGLLPEIIVTAPSGSTLDLMQGSVVLQTYTLSSTETQHTFTVKNTGTYTVRGTSGSDTASVEVVVDVVGRYECIIQYSRLPVGYTEVEYLQSNGVSDTSGSHIVTDVYGNYNYKFEVDFEYTSKPSGTYSGTMIGFFLSSYAMWLGWWPYQSGVEYKHYTTQATNTSIGISTGTRDYWVMNDENNAITKNGTSFVTGLNQSNMSIGSNDAFTLFARNRTTRDSVIDSHAAGKMYYAKITDKSTGNALGEFIPCIRNSDNKPGMFNIITNKFLTNGGTTEFTYGDPV